MHPSQPSTVFGFMKYISTRGRGGTVSFSDAVSQGLASDGGLFLPAQLPDITPFLKEWESLSYPDLCFSFLKLFADDIPEALLRKCVDGAYATFDHPDIAPVRQLKPNLWACELFHGPTLAFKDFALQLLGRLYAIQIERTGVPITVLGATSGDTGAAAIHGLMGLPGIRIFILYPDGKVAPLQERQMTCTGSTSVFPIAIDGSFDDAQRWVKDLFGDLDFKNHYHLSAINSINLARVLAQCVYYIHAWFRIPTSARDSLEVVVPTGNFGNILAGWMLTRMGLPIPHFRIATNQNDILFRLFETGEYRVGNVDPSLAPSMDIQVASNFERFLYYQLNGDAERLTQTMKTFRDTGTVKLDGLERDRFSASRASDADIVATIRRVHAETGYVVDPHTACGFHDIHPTRPTLVMSTAHPAKFPAAIHQAIGIEVTHPTLEKLKAVQDTRFTMGSDPSELRSFVESRLKQA